MNYRLASDVLEGQFGPCEIEVLYQNDRERLAAIKALTGEVLELAMTHFDEQGARKFGDAHDAIVAGGAMGKTFRELEIEFHREVRAIGRQALAKSFATFIDTNGPATIIQADIYVGPSRTLYARVTEIFSHRVVWPTSDFAQDKGGEHGMGDTLPSFESMLARVR